MFDLQSFSAQKSLVSDGPVSIALAKIRGLLTKLLHSPETGVLYLQNDDTVPITVGMICAFTDDNAVQPSVNNDEDLSRAVCIALGDSVDNGDWGFFRFAGEAEVLLVDAIDPEPNEGIYVSGVEGKGTNSPTAVAGEWVKQVGFVLDDSMYTTVTNPFVRILIENCCADQNP